MSPHRYHGPPPATPAGPGIHRRRPQHHRSRAGWPVLLGLALIVAGGWVALKGFRYTVDQEVFAVGGLRATYPEEREVPKWAGLIGLGAGVLMFWFASRRHG